MRFWPRVSPEVVVARQLGPHWPGGLTGAGGPAPKTALHAAGCGQALPWGPLPGVLGHPHSMAARFSQGSQGVRQK